MLQMHVYRELNTLEPKVLWGLSWRQILASVLLAVFGGGTWAILYFLNLSDLGTYVAFAVCVPIAAFGWWRPQGLKPEKYFKYVFRHTAGQTVYLIDGKPQTAKISRKPKYGEK